MIELKKSNALSTQMAILSAMAGGDYKPTYRLYSRPTKNKNRRGIYTRQRANPKNGIRGASGKKQGTGSKRRQYTHRRITK
jgi:hypothetical protein